ncbi:hypothetical protein K6Q96_24400 [Grimontia kaedaensis]|uniref:XRE family transcriptional regulator n=1 Tax=Grimontia kaedaensis TaxID=2872157 RepID=A0ABY4X0R3_9GAMM|nr:hypothetical protein [Grimontia kaedaensis]USH04845.1 hypothetical protein K6Q96_24400 [Grimontia kaedaensis]
MTVENNSPSQVTDKDIERLNELLKNIDSDIALSMAYVRRAHQVSFVELKRKFTGVNVETLQKYMQPSYQGHRPLHVVAAFSWMMMVPMTAFYYGLSLREYYRGMEDSSVEALVRIGKLPLSQFNSVIDIITNLYNDRERADFLAFRTELEGHSDYVGLDYDSLLPPPELDLEAFGEDYYRSLAINLKRFRYAYNVPLETMSKVLGLSDYQYQVLENENKPVAFSVAVGFRGKLGFKLNSHAGFTSEMTKFPQFHHLRTAQHVRDSLIVEALRHLDHEQKESISQILNSLSRLYI